MKYSIVFVLQVLLTFMDCKAQTDSVYFFQRNDIEGVIFYGKTKVWFNNEYKIGMTSLDADAFVLLDSKIKKYLIKKYPDGNIPQQYDDCPAILSSWLDYKRRAIRYYDGNTGHEIILIQYINNNVIGNHPNWNSCWICAIVFGGCSNYWSISYDCNTKRFFDFVVN